MIASIVRLVKVVSAIAAIALLAAIVGARGNKQAFEPASFYKPNCEECHGASAEKKFNPDNPEGQMIDSILNGAKAEGEKDMPAFAQKGITEEKAKALLAYMKSIRE